MYRHILWFFVLLSCSYVHSGITLNGRYHMTSDGFEFVYQLPPPPPGTATSSSPHQNTSHISGIVFLAHGCSHSATDWWPPATDCPQCLGLPVEGNIVTMALRRAYIAIAQSSHNRKTKCWGESDIPRALRTLNWLIQQFHLSPMIPVHLLGASSGGAFVGHLALSILPRKKKPTPPTPRILTAIIQISFIDVAEHEVVAVAAEVGFLFVHMAKDTRTAAAVTQLTSFAERVTKSQNITQLAINPLQLSATYFHDHSPSIPPYLSRLLFNALRNNNFLDASFYLAEDPRVSAWRGAVRAVLSHTPDTLSPSLHHTPDTLSPDRSGVSELMNMAWGRHEITDESLEGVFMFMKKFE